MPYLVQFVGYVIQDEYTEYHLKVTGRDSVSWLVRKRYREFRDLHDNLKPFFPNSLPAIPGKKLWGNQDPDFVRLRQDQLQVYMNGILSLDPDCRYRVIESFLEVQKFAPSPASRSTPSPPVVHAPMVKTSPSSSTSASKHDDLNKIVESLKREIFDLSFTPSLLEQNEYATRRKKYEEIIGNSKLVKGSGKEIIHQKSEFRPSSNGVLGALSEAAFAPIGALPDASKQAISSIIGKSPVASEHDLIAFFSITPPPSSLNVSATSSG